MLESEFLRNLLIGVYKIFVVYNACPKIGVLSIKRETAEIFDPHKNRAQVATHIKPNHVINLSITANKVIDRSRMIVNDEILGRSLRNTPALKSC